MCCLGNFEAKVIFNSLFRELRTYISRMHNAHSNNAWKMQFVSVTDSRRIIIVRAQISGDLRLDTNGKCTGTIRARGYKLSSIVCLPNFTSPSSTLTNPLFHIQRNPRLSIFDAFIWLVAIRIAIKFKLIALNSMYYRFGYNWIFLKHVSSFNRFVLFIITCPDEQ